MNFLRVLLGLILAGIGAAAALEMIFAFFVSLHNPLYGLVLSLPGIVVLVAVIFAFRKVMGQTPPDDVAE
jgi:hypothetical protein